MAEPVACREIRSDLQRVFALTLPASSENAEARLLHAASLVVAHVDPGAVFLMGIFWRDGDDELVLNLHCEQVQRELSALENNDIADADMTIDTTFGAPA